MAYGISIRNKDVELELTKYNLKYLLKPIGNATLSVKDLNYDDFHPNSSRWKNKLTYILPRSVIATFKENGWKFHFLPQITGGFTWSTLEVLPLVDYVTVFRELKNWNGSSDIRFYTTIVPSSHVSMYKFNHSNRYDRMYAGANILVGFQ